MPKRLPIILIIIAAIGITLHPPFAAARPPQLQSDIVITTDNAAQVTELARLGQGSINNLALSADGSTLAISTTLGVWLHGADDLFAPPRLLETADALAVAFSPDGQYVASANGRGGLTVWNMASGEIESELPADNPNGRANAIKFSPDSQSLALSAYDPVVRVWNLATPDDITFLFGHTDEITDVAFSPDGSRLASVSRDLTVRLWDVANEAEVANFGITDAALVSLAFSPDGSRLAVGGEETGIHILDAATGESIALLEGHVGRVDRLAFSPDGSLLVSGGADQSIRLWDMAAFIERNRLVGHVDWIRGLSFSPDGTQVYSTSWDNSVRRWDVATATQLEMVQGYTGRVVGIAFGPGSQYLASGDASVTGLLRLGVSNIRLWSVENLTEIYHYEERDSLARIFFGPQGDAIASASNDGILRQWSVPDGRELGYGSGTLMGFNKDWSLAFFRLYEGDVVQVVDLEDTAEGNRQLLYGHTDTINAVAIDTLDLLVATAAQDGTVRLWDKESAKELVRYQVEGSARSVAFNPESSLLAAGDSAGIVHLWSVDTDDEVHRLEGHTGNVESVIFSADGSLLITAGLDSTVRIWRVSTGEQLAVLNHTVGLVSQVVLNDTGTLLASSGDDGTVRIWGVPAQ